MAVAFLVAACACGPTSAAVPSPTPASQTPVASAAPSHSPAPLPTPVARLSGSYAVIESGFYDQPTYSLSLVATACKKVAHTTARNRSTFAQITNVSVSASTLYYLDGDTDV